MININKNEVNNVYMELFNVSTIYPVYYLFKFNNDSTNDEKIFYKVDTSTNTSNYNLFLIEETTNEDLTDGKVKLDSGQWNYKVYQSSTSSLSLTYSVNSFKRLDYIANGIVNVNETITEPIKFSPSEGIKKTFKPN